MRLRTWAVCVYVGIWVVALAGVEPPQSGGAAPRQTFRSGVTVVQVDVSVLDRDRHPVRGLTAGDLTVLEDGKPRDIVAFTPVELPARAASRTAAPAGWVREVAPDVATNDVPIEGRLVVIVFDWSIRFQDTTLARRIATAIVNGLGPGDQAAVIFTSPFANAGVPQNFTSDRNALLAAINQTFAVAMQGNDSISPKAGGFINTNGELIADPYGYQSGGCHCGACTLDLMTRVATALRADSGRRKVMMFIGDLFRSYEPAKVAEHASMPGLPAPPMSGTVMYLPDVFGPGSCSQPLKEARERMAKAAGLANLTIHVVDPVGLETLAHSPLGGASPDTIATRQADLHVPADMTGGRTVLNTNTPEAAVPAILDESQHYYLLGFAASDAASPQLHRIAVKVNRPGVEVRSRAGYYGNEEATTRNGQGPVTSGIGGILPVRDVPLTLVAAPFALPGRQRGAVALTIGIEPPVVPPGTSSPSTTVEPVHVAVAALDPQGRLIASREQTATLSAGSNRYEVLSRLELTPGRYEIRVAADSPSGRRGSVFTFVDVPKFDDGTMTISGIAIGRVPATPSGPAGVMADLIPFAPTATRTFARTDQVPAFLEVQQGGTRPEPVTLVTRIVDPDGTVVVDDTQTLGPERFGDRKGVDYRFDLPVSRLAPGEYLLTIQATAGKQEERRNVRFSVR
jgi:VWFA-related protein